MDLLKLGTLLQKERKNLKLSLRDAADKIGISHNYLSILEKAKDPRSNSPIKPTIDTLKMIADAYKININKLLKLAGYDDIMIHRTEIESEHIKKAVQDDPDLAKFWDEMKERESLQLLFKQARQLDDKDIKQIVRIIKAIEDEESQE